MGADQQGVGAANMGGAVAGHQLEEGEDKEELPGNEPTVGGDGPIFCREDVYKRQVDGSVGEDDLDGDIALLAECRGLVGSCDKLSCRAARLCDGVLRSASRRA